MWAGPAAVSELWRRVASRGTPAGIQGDGLGVRAVCTDRLSGRRTALTRPLGSGAFPLSTCCPKQKPGLSAGSSITLSLRPLTRFSQVACDSQEHSSWCGSNTAPEKQEKHEQACPGAPHAAVTVCGLGTALTAKSEEQGHDAEFWQRAGVFWKES